MGILHIFLIYIKACKNEEKNFCEHTTLGRLRRASWACCSHTCWRAWAARTRCPTTVRPLAWSLSSCHAVPPSPLASSTVRLLLLPVCLTTHPGKPVNQRRNVEWKVYPDPLQLDDLLLPAKGRSRWQVRVADDAAICSISESHVLDGVHSFVFSEAALQNYS